MQFLADQSTLGTLEREELEELRNQLSALLPLAHAVEQQLLKGTPMSVSSIEEVGSLLS